MKNGERKEHIIITDQSHNNFQEMVISGWRHYWSASLSCNLRISLTHQVRPSVEPRMFNRILTLKDGPNNFTIFPIEWLSLTFITELLIRHVIPPIEKIASERLSIFLCVINPILVQEASMTMEYLILACIQVWHILKADCDDSLISLQAHNLCEIRRFPKSQVHS